MKAFRLLAVLAIYTSPAIRWIRANLLWPMTKKERRLPMLDYRGDRKGISLGSMHFHLSKPDKSLLM